MSLIPESNKNKFGKIEFLPSLFPLEDDGQIMMYSIFGQVLL